MKPERETTNHLSDEVAALAAKPNLRDPRVVLSLLEADQIVAAKQRTRFGKRKLSPFIRTLLWGLRIYVVAMLVIVLISMLRALQATN
jgi:hypothetical protein